MAARLLQQNVATLRSTPLDAWACLIKRMHKIVRVFIAEFELMSQTCGSIFVSMLAYLRASPSRDALLKVSPRASTPRQKQSKLANLKVSPRASTPQKKRKASAVLIAEFELISQTCRCVSIDASSKPTRIDLFDLFYSVEVSHSSFVLRNLVSLLPSLCWPDRPASQFV